MSVRVLDALRRGLPEGLHEPTQKRVRAALGGETVVDSIRAMVVWEPRRVVPSYAVPLEDLRAEVVPAPPAEAGADAPPLLHPGIPFAVHTPSSASRWRSAPGGAEGQGFRPADPALAGYVILDFPSFEDWREEDDPVRGHAADLFHRIDVLPSSRSVRVELDGRVLAESTGSAAALRDEPSPPPRLPPTRRHPHGAPAAEPDALALRVQGSGLLLLGGGRGARRRGRRLVLRGPPAGGRARRGSRPAIFDQRVDVLLDGVRRERPVTAWSRRGILSPTASATSAAACDRRRR